MTKTAKSTQLKTSPRLKPGDSLKRSLFSQTDIENIDSRVDISIMLSAAATTNPLSYSQPA
jgi:hypothetical protein